MNVKKNRIDEMFTRLAAQKRKALITFVTAGDPDLETTRKLVLKMEKEGADLVELGVPFSDPIAEGPVIEEANMRALKNDVRIDRLFELVAKIRQDSDLPLVFLIYVNCVLQYGKEKFMDKCVENGVDGLIVPDLPYEESGEIYDENIRTGVRLIRMVAPSSDDRIETIASKAEGFLYCVSSLGVTGVRSGFKTDFDSFFGKINQHKSAPCAVGFGIATPDQVRELKKYSDGVIVGSAIVRKVAAASSQEEAVASVGELVNSLRLALDEQ